MFAIIIGVGREAGRTAGRASRLGSIRGSQGDPPFSERPAMAFHAGNTLWGRHFISAVLWSLSTILISFLLKIFVLYPAR